MWTQLTTKDEIWEALKSDESVLGLEFGTGSNFERSSFDCSKLTLNALKQHLDDFETGDAVFFKYEEPEQEETEEPEQEPEGE